MINYLAVNLDRSNTGLVLKVEGQIVEIEIEACLEKISNEKNMDFEKDPDVINGLNDFKVDLRTHLNINIIYVVYVARIEILDTTINPYTSFKAYHCGHLEKNTFQRI